MIQIADLNSPLRAVQLTLLEMMLIVDHICKTEGISYWITDGTLLGSERHKGFIPWDDDADIGMLRKDYNKFKKIVASKLPEKFKVETEELHTHGKHNWLKIIYLDDFEWIDWHGIQRKGISLDIFPYDYVRKPNKKTLIEKMVFRIASIRYPDDANNLKNKLRRLINKSRVHDIYNLFNKESGYVTYGIETPYYGYAYYNVNDIFPLKEGIFENHVFKIPHNPHNYLCTVYGEDYMKLPEESKRISHMANLRFSN
ncbi:LicD family protein [Neobacillus sedimentimangrovi]|uniref:LicD family protein n=1 Tax=Neobacillus sedimentimangrovi TaxID=2699460 RepID=UPI0013D45F8A|nr:LicD family protein [Neobacillus sedimentimangrovi]